MSSSLVPLSRASRSIRGILPSSLITVRSIHLLSKTGIASACRAEASVSALSLPSCRHFSFTAQSRTATATSLASDVDDSRAATESIEDENATFEGFKDRLHPAVYKALVVKPFKLKTPSPVQAAVFDMLPGIAEPYKEGITGDRDLLVKAKTGTGKTIGFLVPAIQNRLAAIENVGKDAASPHERRRLVQEYARHTVGTLVISPTRELATQIATEAQKLCEHTDLGVKLFTGGASRVMQLRNFRQGTPDIVVSTPGRLADFLENESDVKEALESLNVLVLDEADTLLHMGFRQEIENILTFLPDAPERQTFMFSATMPPAVMQVARQALSPQHKFLDIVPPKDHSPVHAHIPQYHTLLDSAAQQIPHILRLIAHDQLSNPGKSKVIVFFQTTKMTQLFSTMLRELKRETLPAGHGSRFYEIHSKKAQSSRDNASNEFRNDRSGASVLVTSDVSARGVDYPGVTRVIQVGVPAGREQYIHRVGRTGRAGMSGRGDFVLLPHERKFISSVLSDVPINHLSAKELEEATRELAAKHDDDPKAFMSSARSGTSASAPARFAPKVQNVVEGMPQIVNDFFDRLDPEAVREVFVATLGFYSTTIDDLHVSRGEVLEGMREWATEGLGLAEPPHVSEAMLKKIGMSSDGEPRQYSDRRRFVGSRTPFGMRSGGAFGERSGGGNNTRTSYGMKRGTSPREREWTRERSDRRDSALWMDRGHAGSRR
ncbi:DEAD-domain-containing protein [Vararia minispora EC-137]|uniref:DEAD-domain-containing protein n=1 Tax=Vararia minispora EC-137 TaxID=1314806 RepID=A0ACB8QXG9_9AGAM|nr:DEAD-domain-containing protein [Vararia minispora EC-137]